MKHKKFWYWFSIALIFLILFVFGQMSIKFGENFWSFSLQSLFSQQNSISQDQDFWFEKIENITWTLAISPLDSFEQYSKNLDFLTSQEWQNKIIKIYTYDFTEEKIKNKLKTLLEKGTKIQIIMENYKYRQYKNTRNALKEYFSHYSGFQLHSDKGLQTQYQHAKVTLLNNWFWINTANLTHSSFFKNREYWFHGNNPEILKSLNIIFDKDWSQEKISETDIHPNLLVCPCNCREKIEYLMQNAKESIIMQEQYLLDDGILDILKNKAVNPDFNIKITLANPSDNYKQVNYFWSHRVRVLKSPYIHAKMILIDKKYLVLWSMNISSTSLDKNREIGIIITDPHVIEKFLEQFGADWEKSKKK